MKAKTGGWTEHIKLTAGRSKTIPETFTFVPVLSGGGVRTPPRPRRPARVGLNGNRNCTVSAPFLHQVRNERDPSISVPLLPLCPPVQNLLASHDTSPSGCKRG